jgi:hypothetical protein
VKSHEKLQMAAKPDGVEPVCFGLKKEIESALEVAVIAPPVPPNLVPVLTSFPYL